MIADEKIQLAQEAFFGNSIFPRYAFKVGDPADDGDGDDDGPPTLESHQRKALETLIAQTWQGAQRAGKPIVLDALIKDMKRISATAEEMDFKESGKITYGRITQGIGTHPFVMGEVENANRASSSVARRHFGDFTLNPRCDLLSRVLTKRLGPLEAGPNEELVIWVEPYTPDDREQRREDWRLLAQTMSCSHNELRAGLLGLGSMPGGEQYMPLRMIDIGNEYGGQPVPDDYAPRNER